MKVGPETCVVSGSRARYSCRTVAEVDEHLAGIGRWMERTLPTLSAERRRRVRAQYIVDINALLDAKIMLTALVSLDADLGALTVPA